MEFKTGTKKSKFGGGMSEIILAFKNTDRVD